MRAFLSMVCFLAFAFMAVLTLWMLFLNAPWIISLICGGITLTCWFGFRANQRAAIDALWRERIDAENRW